MLTILTLGFAAAPVSAQTLTVANGTATNEYVPIYGYYTDSYLISQTIYPASMLTSMNGENIFSLTFYLSSMPTSTWGNTFEVRMKEVTSSSFSTESFMATAASDVVYTGQMDPVNSEIEIILDSVYAYNGGNLLLEVRTLDLGTYAHGYFYGVEATDASVQGYDYNDIDSIEAEYEDFIPKTTFGYGTAPTCGKVKNLAVTNVTGATANLSWNTNSLGTPLSYNMNIYDATTGSSTLESTTDTNYTLLGLSESTHYIVGVYTTCTDGSTSDTVFVSFTTTCLSPVDITVGDGTNTTNIYPSNSCYNYSYTQQILPAATIGSDPMDFTSISFQCASVASSNRTWDIYAAPVANTVDLGSSWILPSTVPFQLVYSGSVNVTTGWVKIDLDTVIAFDGASNILISILDHSGSWNCSNYYYYHSDATTANMSRYAYRDGSTYDPTNPDVSGTSSNNVANIKLGFCDQSTCIRPVNLAVSNIGETSADLTWMPIGSESSWEVEYRAESDTEWTNAGTASSYPYTLNGLTENTAYTVHVRALCGGGDVSLYSEMISFRTACEPITQLPYFNNFDTVISDNGTNFITCWSRLTTNPDRVVRCYGSATHSGSYALDFNYSPSCTTAAVTPMLDASIPLNTVMLDFWAYSSLGQGWMEVGTMSDPSDFSTYEFYDTVRLSAAGTWENLIIDFSNYTGNNQYIAFLEINGTTTSYIFDDFTIDYSTNCFHPTNLAVDAFTNTTVTLSWTEAGSATAWEIEYGPAGFTPGTGTTVSAGTNPFTVDNLTPATTYDFYVSANCGSDVSTPFGPVQATPGQFVFGATGSDTLTTCGAIIYDNGGANGNYSSSSDFTLYLYPENPDAKMALVGTLSTESCCDSLSIRDGIGTSGPWLAGYKGTNQNVNVISQSGPLTLIFHSDGSVVNSGFALTASCVTCFPPTNISASNPTLDGATLTWHGNGDSYVLFLNGDMTTGYNASDTTYTFTGLNASSNYTVQIASICNGDTSMLSSVATFATGCGAITITADNPWVEDFESYPGSGVQQFVCWERPVTEVVDNGTAPFVYCHYGQAAHSGTNTAEMKGTLNMLALPEFTNNLSDLRVSFWATGYSYGSTNVEVGYMTDVNDSSTFVPVFANAGTPGARGGSGGGNGNYMGPFSFSNVTVSNARIALRYTGPGSGSGWNVDDFVVELAPACESPMKSSVTASNIGGHVATITWVDPNPNHTAWTVYYKKTSESDWSTAPATDTTVQLTGLDPLTQYDVYVITNCGTPESNPDATHTIHFTTTVACPAPTGLTLASVSTDEATITWNGTASAYNVEYGETGFTIGTGNIDVATTGSITLTNLDPSTSYTIYVNSDCTSDNDSLSTTVSFSFNTTQIPAALPYTADFTQANEWILNNGTCPNYWTLGTVDTTPALFVTNNGTSPGYSISSSSVVSAEKLLAVGDNSSFVISFDVNVGGETSWDYMKVFFAPAENAYPAATSAPTYASYSYSEYAMDFSNYLPQTGYTSYPYKLNLTQGNTLHVTAEMPNPNENATSSSTAKLVFVWKNDSSAGTQPGPTISNVNVIVNSCPMPTDLEVNNVTSSSADISWTDNANSGAWVLEYQAEGSSSWTVENVTTTPSYTLNNLTPSTTYNVRVKTNCGDDESGYVTLTFTTLCASEVAPYSENFSGFNTNVSPCWERFSGLASDVFAGGTLTSTTSGWVFSSSNAFPVGHPKVNIYGSSCKYWLVSPAIDLSQLSSPTLTFDLALTDYANADPIEDTTAQADDKFMVIISTDYGATWTAANATVWNNTGDGNYVYNAISHTGDSITISLSQYAGQTIRIAFYGESTQSGGDNDLHIANVVVDDSGSGPGPVITDPTVVTNGATGIGQTNATLNATITNPSDVTITAKGFQWKTTQGGTYTTVNGTGTGNSFTATLTGLTPNTDYTYKAFITFNGQTVEGSEMTFTTQEQGVEPCDVPTGLHTTDIQNESISIAWDANPNVNSWNIQYKPVGGQLSSASSNTNNYTITGLTMDTQYEIQVQAVCANGTSDWCTAITATTTNVGIDNYLEGSVTLYPNPAKEVVNVQCTMNNVQLGGELHLFDVYGKLLQIVPITGETTQINVSGLAAGLYFVRVTTEEGVVTKTFVKR